MAGNEHPKIALVGDFQCGKSTTFNAILGRELSPCGNGIKTSAIPFTVSALDDCGEEFAEPVWSNCVRLDTVVRAAEELADDENAGELRHIATIIANFRGSRMLTSLRARSRIPVEEARKWGNYPRDWAVRWNKDASGQAFRLEEILFAFLDRIVFHIRSDTLRSLCCELTDVPGFDAGYWDTFQSRREMISADGVLCVLDGRQSTIKQVYINELLWLVRAGHTNKIRYVLNGEEKKHIEDMFCADIAILRKFGIPVTDDNFFLFNARLANLSAVGGDGDKSVKKQLRSSLCRWLNLDPMDDDERRQCESVAANHPQLLRESGITAILAGMSDLASTARHKSAAASAKVVADEDGYPVPARGYGWDVPDVSIPILFGGVVWRPGTAYDVGNNTHIVAAPKEGFWRPETGYAWGDETGGSNMRRQVFTFVLWAPGSSHRDLPHVLAAETEGKWKPEAGYEWMNASSDVRKMTRGVVWRPGTAYDVGNNTHIVAAPKEGFWHPETGYAWGDETGGSNMRRQVSTFVLWAPGSSHRDLPHVLAAETEGKWKPEAGYEWMDASSDVRKMTWGVVWRPGLTVTKNGKRFVSGREVGIWLRAARSRQEILDAFSGIVCNRLYIGHIPIIKTINARITMRIPEDHSSIFVLFDNTFFGGSCEGFAVTDKAVFAKEIWKAPVRFSWDEISSISVIPGCLQINNCCVKMVYMKDESIVEKIFRAFKKLIDP